MSVYQGYDVLELNYNRIGRIEDRIRRKFVLFDNETGTRSYDEQTLAGVAVRPFSWLAVGRAEMREMLDFLDARKGRAVPFWLPTFQWDLAVKEDILASSPAATIRWVGYTTNLWPATGARRHIGLWDIGVGSMDYYEVTAAADPGDGVSENLTISPVAVREYLANRTVISFLRLCRLETDDQEIRYPSGDVAEATIQVRELPQEVPTI